MSKVYIEKYCEHHDENILVPAESVSISTADNMPKVSVVKPGGIKLDDFMKILGHNVMKQLSIDYEEKAWCQYNVYIDKVQWGAKLLRDATENEKGFD